MLWFCFVGRIVVYLCTLYFRIVFVAILTRICGFPLCCTLLFLVIYGFVAEFLILWWAYFGRYLRLRVGFAVGVFGCVCTRFVSLIAFVLLICMVYPVWDLLSRVLGLHVCWGFVHIVALLLLGLVYYRFTNFWVCVLRKCYLYFRWLVLICFLWFVCFGFWWVLWRCCSVSISDSLLCILNGCGFLCMIGVSAVIALGFDVGVRGELASLGFD